MSDLYNDIVLPLVRYADEHMRTLGREVLVEAHLDAEIYDRLAAEAAGRLTTALIDHDRERMIFPPSFLPHPSVMLTRGIE